MTEAEVRAQIDTMQSRINSAVVDVNWNMASLGRPRTRYVWFQMTPVLVWLNDYLSHWWFETGQIWYDGIDVMVNAVGRTIYEIYYSLKALEVNLDNIMSANVLSISNWTAWAMNRIVDYVADEVDVLENWISFSIESLYAEIDAEIQQIHTDLGAIIAEERLWVAGEIAKITLDIDQDLQDVKDYADQAVKSYSDTVDLLFADLYADLQENVSKIEESISSLASDAMSWILDKVGQVWDWLTDTGNAIYQFIRGEISTVTNYITNWIGQITEWVNSVILDFTIAFSQVYQKIVDEINWVMDQVKIVTDAVKATLESAIEVVKRGLDWSNQFFNLALAFPEIGMLSALSRDDTEFDYFRPYWQAFLARLLT